VTETQKIELGLRGKSCFVMALESHETAGALGKHQSAEKEAIVLSVVADAHAILEGALADSGENLSAEDLLWIKRGISLACEEWIRSPEDINTVGV